MLRSLLMFSILLVLSGDMMAQIVVWQETYDGTGNWGTLNQSAGPEGCNANPFFISCQENGNSVGSCGSGCGTNNTLHVGSIAYGDVGAAYDTGGGTACGGLLNCLFGGLCNCLTNRRSTSAVISTVGYTGIQLEFDYIEEGSGSVDNAFVEYSTNSGSTWNTLLDMPKTNNTGCGGQGRWTHIVIPLPASCENIATLMIAFRWVNNNDLVGTDPSFAANDVQVVQPMVLPVELIDFNALPLERSVRLQWTTSTELNNDHFVVERAGVTSEFQELDVIQGMGNSYSVVNYEWTDLMPIQGTAFYRLRQVDHDGRVEYSPTVSIDFDTGGDFSQWSIRDGQLLARTSEPLTNGWQLFDARGCSVRQGASQEGTINIDIEHVRSGVYVLRCSTTQGAKTRAFVIP